MISHNCNRDLDEMKWSLKSATKLKLDAEMKVFKLRNTERSLCEELYSTKSKIEYLTEQLEDLKDQIYETSYEITRIDINKSCEKIKLEHRINFMNNHKKTFDEMFAKERDLLNLRNFEIKQRELDEEEQERLRKKKIQERNQLNAATVAAIEEESLAIERECAVLKKRNNAIMLKLRRKLVETEDTRKKLLKKNAENP